MARTKHTSRFGEAGRSLPRLPSGVYFSLLADSAAHEAQYVHEYPTFPSSYRAEGGNQPATESVVLPPIGSTTDLPSRPAAPTPQRQLCLPLVSVAIDMQVDHTIAKTKVVQTFTNPGSVAIPEAWYSFPLYDGAAITAFRFEIGDDKVLQGKVKPTEEARQEFKTAAQKQEAAALVEEMTPDVFQTTIGNIAPKTTVRVEITYVEELHTDLGGDGVLMTIPTSVAPRYGTPPAGFTANSTMKETDLSIVVNVTSSGAARRIACRSGHSIAIEYERTGHVPGSFSIEDPTTPESQPGSKDATIRMSHDAAMDKDFILFIPSAEEGLQRSQALLTRSNDLDHAALMVTVRPSELFSDLRESMSEFDGEVLFLADRSGSMRGEKIEELKNALFVFVKSLPPRCKFNLYSFGNAVRGLWPSSMPYGEDTVQQALAHISTFDADYGGTEVLNALKKAVGDRQSTGTSSSTQVILLTDGEIWQADETIEFVRMNASNADSQLRFFSLGLGDHVSHQLIQGIGLFGGGFGEVATVDTAGKWKEAVIRILKGAIMPNSWSYSISIGDQWGEKRLDVDDILPQPVGESTHPSFIQAPRKVPLLHHFGQQSVYFLLDARDDKLPEQVLITASSQHSGTKTATLRVTAATCNSTTIQHLAAKAAVRDLESQDVPDAISSDIIRRNAEHLCQMYSISSKWASFVAVSHLQQQPTDSEFVEVSLYKAPLAEADLSTSLSSKCDSVDSYTRPFGDKCGKKIARINAPQKQLASRAARASEPSSKDSVMASAQSVSDARSEPSFSAYESSGMSLCFQKPKKTLPSPFSSASAEGSSFMHMTGAFSAPVPSEQRFAWSDSVKRSKAMPSPFPDAGARSATCAVPTEFQPEESIQPVDDPYAISWRMVVRHQRVDGLFDLDKCLADRLARHFYRGTQQALGRWVKEHAADDTEMDGSTLGLLVNTVMALAYLRSHYNSQRALWELLVQKAEGSVASRLAPGKWDQPDGLSAMADSAVAHVHYGGCSQNGAAGDWWERGSGGGRCGVCNTQGAEQPSPAGYVDGPTQCLSSGCDISVSPWDRFWSHAIEQHHIHSSCATANDRYEAAVW